MGWAPVMNVHQAQAILHTDDRRVECKTRDTCKTHPPQSKHAGIIRNPQFPRRYLPTCPPAYLCTLHGTNPALTRQQATKQTNKHDSEPAAPPQLVAKGTKVPKEGHPTPRPNLAGLLPTRSQNRRASQPKPIANQGRIETETDGKKKKRKKIARPEPQLNTQLSRAQRAKPS